MLKLTAFCPGDESDAVVYALQQEPLVSNVVRLADDRWHGILAYRLLAFPKARAGQAEPVVPQTGCFLEEILCHGDPIPPWQF